MWRVGNFRGVIEIFTHTIEVSVKGWNELQFVEKACHETTVYFQNLFFSNCGGEIA
jgi:hypothetical protein